MGRKSNCKFDFKAKNNWNFFRRMIIEISCFMKEMRSLNCEWALEGERNGGGFDG